MQTHHRNSRIAVVETTNRGGNDKSAGFENIKPDMTVEDRYYTKAEYKKLSPEQKKGLSNKRKSRGQKPGEKTPTNPKDRKRKSNMSNKQFKKRMIKAMKSMKIKTEEESEGSSEEEEPKETQGNRNNKALRRKST